MKHVDFEIKTERDPWWMSQKRTILWLCIYKYHKGYWRIINIDVAIKIAKIVYSFPLDFKNLIYSSHLNPALKFIHDGNSWLRLCTKIKIRACQCKRPLFNVLFIDNNHNRRHFISCGINHLSGLDVFEGVTKKWDYNKLIYLFFPIDCICHIVNILWNK
jgi:hypothetical protein